MELKKNDSVNTEKLRIPIMFTGLLFVGSLVLASFSYTVHELEATTDKSSKKSAQVEYQMDAPKPPEPETPPPTQVDVPPPPEDDIEEVENTEEEPAPAVDVPPPAPPGPIEQPRVQAEIVEFPDVEAGFPGGTAEMHRWIQQNMQYPQTSVDMGEQGKVYVKFVVQADGSISDVEIERGVSDDLDKEAKRVIRKMPKWIPGEAGGKRVPTRCRIPIVFELG